MIFMTTVIIGGGVAGLTAAYELAKRKERVIVVEKNKELGGLLSSFKTRGAPIECFYHHLFPFYHEFFSLCGEMGLSKKIVWMPASTGFYYGNRMYRLTSPLDLMFYRPLGMLEKFSMAKNLLKMRKIADSSKYDNITAKEFILKSTSRTVYEKVYAPLLRDKFGKYMDEISAAWFIERMNLRNRRGLKGEKLGYLRGGFYQFLDRLAEKIKGMGGEIQLNAKINGVGMAKNRINAVYINGKRIKTDHVISTMPPQELSKVIKLPKEYVRKFAFTFETSVCVILGLDKRLFDYYWINMIEPALKFGAVIEHTNFMPLRDYKDHIVYLASYTDKDSKLLKMSAKEVLRLYLADLQRVAPDLKLKDVKWWRVCVSPNSVLVYKKGVTTKVRRMGRKTPIKNLFVCGAFNSYPEGSINESVKGGMECAKLVNK